MDYSIGNDNITDFNLKSGSKPYERIHRIIFLLLSSTDVKIKTCN